MGATEAEVISQIQGWFAERGFRLDFGEENGEHWAGLVAIRTGRLFAPRYGRGDSPVAAAERAKGRYIEEQ